jgi:uncharacterized protein
MLRLHINQLRDDPTSTEGTLQPDDPAFEGLGLRFLGPVQVAGALQRAGDGDFLWRGHVRARFAGECRRCLSSVTLELDDDVDVMFSADPDLAEDPSAYPLAPEADLIDVIPAVREELVLRVSAFPLCRPDCKGLCAKCGADLNAGTCSCVVSGSTN